MTVFKAVVTDKYTGTVEIWEKEYRTKKNFIEDIRSNGYSCTDWKVKEADLFDHILDLLDNAEDKFTETIIWKNTKSIEDTFEDVLERAIKKIEKKEEKREEAKEKEDTVAEDFFEEVNAHCIDGVETVAFFTNSDHDFIQVTTENNDGWKIEVTRNNTVITDLEFDTPRVLKDIIIKNFEACGITKRL